LLKVYHSNSLDVLRDLLVEMVSAQPITDPFCAEQILVQSPGMAQWLKLELAQRLSIAANVEFPLPASFLWRTFSQLLVEVPERSAYSKESMTWILMRLLPDYLERVEFHALGHYMTAETAPLRLYQLCEKVADLFDQYLVYRPDWIAQWESNTNAPASEEERWQPILWRAIVADTAQRSLPHWHRANMFDAFIQAIEGANAIDIPQRIFVFGISALPENYLQALVALGQRCDIHLMVNNPCRQFWSDIVDRRYLGKLSRQGSDIEQPSLNLYDQGNPLLSSMGKLGRDYLYLLGQMDLIEVQLFSEDNNSNLLKSIQTDILSLRNRRAAGELCALTCDEQRLAISSSDSSVQLHRCHSAMREVEVLQDQLLSMLEQDSQLQPRDIIVMMPDVSVYSPFVEAVFGQVESNRYLPFSISDRNAQQELPIISNFLALLNVSKGRYAASDIIEILSFPSLLRRFELDEIKFEKLRHWVLESGIKWGLDGSNRQELSLPGFDQNSWQFGLDRMFAGYTLGDIEQTWQGISAYCEIHGLEATTLGQLSRFIELLHRCKQQFNASASISQWIAFFNQLLSDLYLADDNDLAALALIHRALEKLQEMIVEVHYQQDIPADIILDYLQQSLSAERSGQKFLSGQINFCTLMPMRAIPFKVVCLLGMNDQDYPRSVPSMGFDLMVEHPRKGDRSRRDDDRYLFLEALLSAKSTLYMSYIGRSLADNRRKEPSVLVSELLEYAQQGYYLAEKGLQATDNLISADILQIQQQARQLLEHLATDHPLTPYHRSYFDRKNALFSYAQQWLPIASAKVQQSKASFIQSLPAFDFDGLALTELCAFFKHPIRYFLQHRLQVNFVDEEALVEDEEPFILNGLDNYIVRDRLLNQAVLEKNIQQFGQYLQSSGLMPVGLAGSKSLQKNLHDATDLAHKVLPLLVGKMRRLSFDLALENTQLRGWIEPLYDVGVVKFTAAKSSGRGYISTWIEHLAACANGCQHTPYYRAINEQFHYLPVPVTTAKNCLESLLSLYRRGLVQPLPWLADLGWQWFSSEDDEKFLQSVEKNYNSFDDPYIQRVFPQWKDILHGLSALNEEIFSPLAQYLVNDTEEC
jgi:exodeoxyribonuclease V gamma subunit